MFPNKFTFINDIDQLIEQVKDIIDTWDEISSSFKIKLVRMKDNSLNNFNIFISCVGSLIISCIAFLSP